MTKVKIDLTANVFRHLPVERFQRATKSARNVDAARLSDGCIRAALVPAQSALQMRATGRQASEPQH
jgi:hypothetical protein